MVRTLFFTSENEENANSEGRSRRRTLFFSRENEKNANFEGRSRSRTLFFSRKTEKNMNFNDCWRHRASFFSGENEKKKNFNDYWRHPALVFSRAREPNPYPGVAEPYLEPLPQKSRKNPGPKKPQFLMYFYVKIFNFSSPAPRNTFVGFSDV